MIAIIMIISVVLAVMLGGILLQRCKYLRLSQLLEESHRRNIEAGKREHIYKRLLPNKLFELFQQGEPENLKIGEVKSLKTTVLSYNVSGFAGKVRQQSSKEIFSFVNNILRLVVPCILYQEGEIDEYVDAGLSAFFLNAPERALQSAISVCEALNQAGIREPYSIGLTYGDVIVGMVGHEKRFGILTISDTTGLAEFLRELAVRYRARILITGSFKKQIPDFDKYYNSRYLGDIYLKAAGCTEALYDVYDGDVPADKNGKRKTRLLFENGVDLFHNKNFHDARLHFIEVLKANRMDGAAKEYLFLCNRYIATEDSGKGMPSYLEVY
ncbi:MAG: adenylate/guanylate cyclase domain-containing protein [Lachnospiraceae bacterium]|nr:adenylate/guanylate cyclase domain-containing protein [Lachnospiraceae bacterium]